MNIKRLWVMARILWILVVVFGWSAVVRADTHYVAPPGVGVNPSAKYTNWSIAATSIMDVIIVTTAGSLCINSGINQAWMTNAIDLDGKQRLRYGNVDRGAYELIYDGTIYRFH